MCAFLPYIAGYNVIGYFKLLASVCWNERKEGTTGEIYSAPNLDRNGKTLHIQNQHLWLSPVSSPSLLGPSPTPTTPKKKKGGEYQLHYFTENMQNDAVPVE